MKKFKGPNFLYNIAISIPKRLRFVISSVVLTGAILLTTFFDFNLWWIMVAVLFLLTYFFTYFSLLEGVQKAEWLVLFIMPVFLTLFSYFFYFLFPVRWLTRVPFIIIYGFSFYAILLTSNIFNVGVEKNLQLYRAAFSINFLFQTLIVFLAMQVMTSFRQNFLINGLIAFAVLFPLGLQLLWSVKPQVHLERSVIVLSLVMGLLMAQTCVVLSFLPIKSTIFSLGMTASYYSVSGLMYHFADDKLFKQTIREYVFVIAFVLAITILTIPW